MAQNTIHNETSTDKLQAYLLQMQIEEIERQRADRAAKEADATNIERRMREIGLKGLQQRMEEERLSQEQCHHLKPNGTPNTCCQRSHHRNYIWLCQKCNKKWINNTIPAHLKLSGEQVGGPTS